MQTWVHQVPRAPEPANGGRVQYVGTRGRAPTRVQHSMGVAGPLGNKITRPATSTEIAEKNAANMVVPAGSAAPPDAKRGIMWALIGFGVVAFLGS